MKLSEIASELDKRRPPTEYGREKGTASLISGTGPLGQLQHQNVVLREDHFYRLNEGAVVPPPKFLSKLVGLSYGNTRGSLGDRLFSAERILRDNGFERIGTVPLQKNPPHWSTEVIFRDGNLNVIKLKVLLFDPEDPNSSMIQKAKWEPMRQ